MFRHYLITRLNTYMGDDWGTDPKLLVDKDWLYYRLEMFLRYTYPCIKRQINQNFKYVILAHPDTPRSYKVLLNALRFKVIFTEYGYSDDLKKYLKEDCDQDIIVTSALDSDDIIEDNYIDAVQQYIDISHYENGRFLIKFKNGFLYHLNSDMLYTYFHENNQFINLIENKDSLKSCYHCGHTKINNMYPSIDSDQSTWIYIEHDINDSGKIIGTDLMRFIKPVYDENLLKEKRRLL